MNDKQVQVLSQHDILCHWTHVHVMAASLKSLFTGKRLGKSHSAIYFLTGTANPTTVQKTQAGTLLHLHLKKREINEFISSLHSYFCLPLFLMTSTSPHSSSMGRKISGTTMRMRLLCGGFIIHTQSTLDG